MKSRNNLVGGHGINEADYPVTRIVNGKRVRYPFYKTWKEMFRRVYSQEYHERNHTHIGTTSCDEWHSFTRFRAWMMSQDWEGQALEKDIRFPRNKVYSPNACLFTPVVINNLLTGRGAARGAYPRGVCFHKAARKFEAKIKKRSKHTHLDLFPTAEQAHAAYLWAKIQYVFDIAMAYPDQRILDGLVMHTIMMREEAGLCLT